MSALVIIPPEELRAMLREVVREELRAVAADRGGGGGDRDYYLSVQRASEMAEVHPDTIRNWVKTGRLPEHRAGRELRILCSELRRFLDAGDLSEHRETVEEEATTIFARRRSG